MASFKVGNVHFGTWLVQQREVDIVEDRGSGLRCWLKGDVKHSKVVWDSLYAQYWFPRFARTTRATAMKRLLDHRGVRLSPETILENQAEHRRKRNEDGETRYSEGVVSSSGETEEDEDYASFLKEDVEADFQQGLI